jgi:Predicted sugar phosphate isomerase involved in capsule formation
MFVLKKYSITFAFMNREKLISILEHEAEAILHIPITQEYENAINLITKQVHLLRGTLITSGMGKAGQVAMNIATTFSSTGTSAYFLHPSEAQHGDLGIIRKNDVLLLVSNSGKTRELLELVQLAKRLVEDINYIVITSNPDSPLAKNAAVCLLTGSPEEVCPLGLTPTTSTTTMIVIGNLLVVSVMKQINFNSSDYAKRHHGGYLGSKSRKLSKEEEKIG